MTPRPVAESRTETAPGAVDAPKWSKQILLLVGCALMAITFAAGGAAFVVMNTVQFDKSNEWLEHTHAVIEQLQAEGSRLDRMEASLQLYKVTSDEANLRIAQAGLVSFNGGLLRIQDLVRDNESETRHGKELELAAKELSAAVEGTSEFSATPTRQFLESRNAVSVMLNEEHRLLVERTREARKVLLHSYLIEGASAGISLIALMGLFSILLRDALKRRSFDRKLALAHDDLASSVQALGQRVSEAAMLKNARDELQLCLTAEDAYRCAAMHFGQMLPGSSGAAVLVNNSRSALTKVARWNDERLLLDGFEMDTCCGLRAGRPRWRRMGASEIHCKHFSGAEPESYMCIPLAALGETMGFVFINLETAEAERLAESRIAIVHELVELVAMATSGLNLRAKLENQSIRDGLTNLFNRHFMEIALERELQRATRHGTMVALVMLDVDHFKMFNDTYGHEAGDLILRELADCLQSSVRSEDVVCRYGGEEFVLILPEITHELAMKRVEAIRECVSLMQIPFRGQMLRQITISAGIGMYPNPAMDSVELLRLADRGLYGAKRAGRNQVQMLTAG